MCESFDHEVWSEVAAKLIKPALHQQSENEVYDQVANELVDIKTLGVAEQVSHHLADSITKHKAAKGVGAESPQI